ncbi:hypothetical protein MUP59_04260 [Candidatus Bathyarchaeota archaeon]|nr:hypothetical protein [Candidatus Bathyarchaeota archaeon]
MPDKERMNKINQVTILVDRFMRILDQDGYRFEFSDEPSIRICGVQEGELMFAIRCKVFRNKKKVEKSE